MVTKNNFAKKGGVEVMSLHGTQYKKLILNLLCYDSHLFVTLYPILDYNVSLPGNHGMDEHTREEERVQVADIVGANLK